VPGGKGGKQGKRLLALQAERQVEAWQEIVSSPVASAAELEAVFQEISRPGRRRALTMIAPAIVAHPNVPPAILAHVCREALPALSENPLLPFLLLESPELYTRLPLWELVHLPECSPVLLEIIAERGDPPPASDLSADLQDEARTHQSMTDEQTAQEWPSIVRKRWRDGAEQVAATASEERERCREMVELDLAPAWISGKEAARKSMGSRPLLPLEFTNPGVGAPWEIAAVLKDRGASSGAVLDACRAAWRASLSRPQPWWATGALYALAQHPNVPLKALLQETGMAQSATLRRIILRHERADASVRELCIAAALKALGPAYGAIGSSNWLGLVGYVLDRATPDDPRLDIASRDPRWRVRIAAALSPALTPQLLGRLAQDANQYVRTAARTRLDAGWRTYRFRM